jgi:hypothetical protein
MLLSEYHLPLGIVLVVIGMALICSGLILRRRAQTEPAEAPGDTGELCTFVDSLQPTNESEHSVGKSTSPQPGIFRGVVLRKNPPVE